MFPKNDYIFTQKINFWYFIYYWSEICQESLDFPEITQIFIYDNSYNLFFHKIIGLFLYKNRGKNIILNQKLKLEPNFLESEIIEKFCKNENISIYDTLLYIINKLINIDPKFNYKELFIKVNKHFDFSEEFIEQISERYKIEIIESTFRKVKSKKIVKLNYSLDGPFILPKYNSKNGSLYISPYCMTNKYKDPFKINF